MAGTGLGDKSAKGRMVVSSQGPQRRRSSTQATVDRIAFANSGQRHGRIKGQPPKEITPRCSASAALIPSDATPYEENVRGCTLLLSAQFQGYCRDLYTECAQVVASRGRPSLQTLIQSGSPRTWPSITAIRTSTTSRRISIASACPRISRGGPREPRPAQPSERAQHAAERREASAVFHLGDRVKIKHHAGVPGRIVELRGALGPGGATVYRVLGRKPVPADVQVLGGRLQPAPAGKTGP
jgi:hypothetical protein